MKKGSILIIEDEVQLNNFLVEFMKSYFENVYSALDGEEGFILYDEKKPDVIITDIDMPKLDGLKLCEQIRNTDGSSKIIILSAHPKTENLFKAIKLNLVTFLVKPVTYLELKETIDNIQSSLIEKDIFKINSRVHFNTYEKKLFDENREISLTKREKDFLSILIKKIGICVSNDELSYGLDAEKVLSNDALASLIKRLRKKLPDDIIKSCFGEGYKLIS
jgi:DNA-binding response OmpR family regulator